MLEKLVKLDIDTLIFLNNLGSEQWDFFWLSITNQFNWVPLFILILYLIIKTYGWKRGGIIMLSMIVLVAFSDQFTNFIKYSVQRLRPNNDPEVMSFLRSSIWAYKNPQGYSFMSGHATTSTFFTVYTFLTLKKYFKKYIYLLFIFPLIFSYSRIYLGVHFPLDILVGFFIGTSLAILYYKLFIRLFKKTFV